MGRMHKTKICKHWTQVKDRRDEVRCVIRLLQLTSSSFQAWHRQSPTDFQLFMERCVTETLRCKTGLKRCQRKLTVRGDAGHHVLQKSAMRKVEIQHAHCRSQEPETIPTLQNWSLGHPSHLAYMSP